MHTHAYTCTGTHILGGGLWKQFSLCTFESEIKTTIKAKTTWKCIYTRFLKHMQRISASNLHPPGSIAGDFTCWNCCLKQTLHNQMFPNSNSLNIHKNETFINKQIPYNRRLDFVTCLALCLSTISEVFQIFIIISVSTVLRNTGKGCGCSLRYMTCIAWTMSHVWAPTPT